MDSHQRPPEERAFSVFAFLWAVAVLFDIVSHWTPASAAANFLAEGISLALAVLVLLRPSSLGRFIAFTAANAVALYTQMPVVNNHELFIFLVHVTFVAIFVRLSIASGSPRTVARADFYRAFVPAVRLSAIGLYFWATVHKLNSGFLSPDLSCATVLLFRLQRQEVFGLPLAFISTESWVRYASIYGTLVIEGALVPLLFFRRTRLAAVPLALVFHFGLGFVFFTFSAMLYALLALFLPSAFWEGLSGWWEARQRRVARWIPIDWSRGRAWCAGLLLPFMLGVLIFKWEWATPGAWKASPGPGLWLVYGLVLMAVFVAAVVAGGLRRIVAGAKRDVVDGRPALHGLRLSVMLLPLAVLLNGLCPYLGLKTTQSFAMYSNLTTEGGRSNHLFIPISWQIWDYAEDLVRIHSSSDPVLRELSVPSWSGARNNPVFVSELHLPSDHGLASPPSWRLPYATLRQYIGTAARHGRTDIHLVYERGGSVESIGRAEEHPELARVPWLRAKLNRPRAVPSIEQGCCMW